LRARAPSWNPDLILTATAALQALGEDRSTQDAAVECEHLNRLHELRNSGELTRFILPYLGQQDRELQDPPADLVRLEEAHAYPTDFNAMSEAISFREATIMPSKWNGNTVLNSV